MSGCENCDCDCARNYIGPVDGGVPLPEVSPSLAERLLNRDYFA